jgi:hypothetical protein
LVFTVHELLQLAQFLMKTTYDQRKPRREDDSIHYGEHFHPQKLTSPAEWLAASSQLEQGTPKSLQATIEQNQTEYRGKQWLALIDYYREKINIEDLNRPPQLKTMGVWSYAKESIANIVPHILAQCIIDNNLSDYRYADLGALTQAPTECETLKKSNVKETKKVPQPKPRPRGFYLYKMDGTSDFSCLIIHAKNRVQHVSLSQDSEIPTLIQKLAAVKKEKLLLDRRDRDKFAILQFCLQANIKLNLTHTHLNYFLRQINRYLLDIQYSLTPLEQSDFLGLFIETYAERCRYEADSTCMTHLRCIIHDLITEPVLLEWYRTLVFPQGLDVLKTSLPLSGYVYLLKTADKEDPRTWDQGKWSTVLAMLTETDIPSVSLDEAYRCFQQFCETHQVGLYARATPEARFNYHIQKLCELATIAPCVAGSEITYRHIGYFLAYLRNANHRGWTVDVVETEIQNGLASLTEKGEAYERACVRESAFHLLCKRIRLFEHYNALLLVRALSLQLDIPALVNLQSEAVTQLIRYHDLFEKILSAQPKSLSYYYSSLRLFCRSGASFSEQDKRKLLDELARNRLQEISCEDMCVTSNRLKVDGEKNLTSFSKPTIEFFVIGDRVVGVNQHDSEKPLYVYDYGSTKDTFAVEYQEMQRFSRARQEEFLLLKDQHSLFESYFDAMFAWYSQLLTYPELAKAIVLKQIFFDTDVGFAEIDKLKSALHKRANTFSDELFRIQHLESMMLYHIIKPLFLKLEMKFVRRSSNKSALSKDTLTVTYPQICRQLAMQNTVDQVSIMRGYLDGNIQTTEEAHRPLVVLTAAWFLAETGRNPLTFMSTLMMMDLITAGIQYNTRASHPKYYHWGNLIWNQTILQNQASSDDREKNFPQQEGWAGKQPMCHGGSYARLFKQERFPPIELALGQVRQKEGTILLNWLSEAIKQAHPDIEIETLTLHGKSKPSHTYSQKIPFFIYEVGDSVSVETPEKSNFIEQVLKPLISARLENFATQLIPRSQRISFGY